MIYYNEQVTICKKLRLNSAFDVAEPIDFDDLNDLTLTITFLTKFIQISDLYDWEVGKHGVEFEYQAESEGEEDSENEIEKAMNYYLPQYIKDMEWNQLSTIRYLCKIPF